MEIDTSVFRVDDELTPEEEQSIREYFRDGISYEVDWAGSEDEDGHLKIITIHWRPGDPNRLAECIIREVKGRMGLMLDGHRYWIEPQGGQDDGNVGG